MAAHHPIFLFRHGETVWNAEKRAQSHLDSPLTDVGRQQARIMGEALARKLAQANHQPHEILVRASPLGRVRETLAIAAEAAGLVHDDTCFDPRLIEMSWGDWEGLNGAEIEARWPGEMAARRLNRWHYAPPNGESLAMAMARAQPALDHIITLAAERPVAVFAHGAIGRVMRGLFVRAPDSEILDMDQPQDAFFRLHAGSVTRIAAAEETGRREQHGR